ncbi:zinc finger BED domain-containing protein 5-like [Octopus bimaculoides]|uniref:zinc finger BED domain-containing protein 5-like n=1 Tax=Octopus bimaculoides TaxID=37653 RepID=UPI0022E2D4CA|nr:zinc finger BED domain-containing protein 5-like [Octopus bimaculoides]
MIHHEVLVSKSLPDGLLKWMDNIVKVVNYIKSHSLLRRVFAALCETMDSDFKCILLHTEVCWLSKGKVLSRFINNDNWWLDLFEKLNVSNLSLQKVNENIITITGKLKFFTSKLELWLRKVKNSQLDCFPGVETFPNKLKILSEVQKTVIAIIAVAYLQSALMKQIQSKTKDIQKAFAVDDTKVNNLMIKANEDIFNAHAGYYNQGLKISYFLDKICYMHNSIFKNKTAHLFPGYMTMVI